MDKKTARRTNHGKESVFGNFLPGKYAAFPGTFIRERAVKKEALAR